MLGISIHRQWRVGLLLVLVFLAASCGKKDSVTAPEATDVGATSVEVQGRDLRWSTAESVRASVRYGSDSGSYRHMAYPRAATRRDRAYLSEHSVPLLGIETGQTVYYQLVHELRDGTVLYTAEQSFVSEVDPPAQLLTSTMVHIGWGDCHVITMPTTGEVMLFDAGDYGAGRGVREYLEMQGITSIATALSSHVHVDHIGGLVGGFGNVGVLEEFPPQTYLDSPPKIHDRNAYDNLVNLLSKQSIDRVVIERGDTDDTIPALALDPEVDILVLNSGLGPDLTPVGFESDNINNESIVLKFSYGDVDFIIGGDAENPAEGSIVDAFGPEILNVEYYKAHHHGRHDGSGNRILEAMQARVSLIPVSWRQYSEGREGYEDETYPTAERIRRAGGHWYVLDDLPFLGIPDTGRVYNLSFVTDGVSYEVRADWALQTTKTTPGADKHCR